AAGYFCNGVPLGSSNHIPGPLYMQGRVWTLYFNQRRGIFVVGTDGARAGKKISIVCCTESPANVPLLFVFYSEGCFSGLPGEQQETRIPQICKSLKEPGVSVRNGSEHPAGFIGPI